MASFAVGAGKIRLPNNFSKIIFSLFAFSCVHQKTYEHPTIQIKLEIKHLELSIQDAREAQVDILSPYNFSHAEKSLAQAKSTLDSNALADSQEYLRLALSTAKTAHNNIEDVIQARKAAIDANANHYFVDDFADADRHLRWVCQWLETQEIDPAMNNRTSMKQDYLYLERLSILAVNAEESRQLIERAKKRGIDKQRGADFVAVKRQLSELEDIIRNDPHSSEIKLKAARLLRAAEVLNN